ncbi:hypothetical protein M4Z11_07345, partial [Bartonella sp. G70]|nr:hypothetical protein [Bartonella sp. G70]
FLICVLASSVLADNGANDNGANGSCTVNISVNGKKKAMEMIELPEGVFVVRISLHNSNGKKITDSESVNISFRNSAKRKELIGPNDPNEVSPNEACIHYNKDHGGIGIYSVGWLDAKTVKIKGPVKEDNTTIKYIGVYVKEYGSVNAEELHLEDLTTGLYALENSTITMVGGMIKNSQIAVHASGEAATIELESVDITVAYGGIGLFSQGESIIQMEGKSIDFTGGTAVRIKEGEISLEKVNITNTITENQVSKSSDVDNAFVDIYPKSTFSMENGNVSLDNAHGLVFNIEKGTQEKQSTEKDTKVNIEDVNIQVNGQQFYGVYVKPSDAQTIENSTSDIVVSLKKTKITVPEHTVIYNKVNQKL